MMIHEEMKRLMSEFGFDLTEDVNDDIAGQLSRAEKLDEVDTVTFGLETDDNKVVKVFVNAKDAEKFEKIMADCLGSTDSIEDAINKAAAEVDIIDVEWPEDEDGDEDADAEDKDTDTSDDGSSALDPAVYGKDSVEKKDKKTMAKKDDTMEGLSYGEHFSHVLTEDHGSISSRMTTPNQQLIYQALLDLGIPELALDRSPYRSAIIKGLRIAAQELASNSPAKIALKAFVKGRIEDNKHSKDHELKKDEPKAAKEPVVKPKDVEKPKAAEKEPKPDAKEPVEKKHIKHEPPMNKKPIKEAEDDNDASAPNDGKVVMSAEADGMMLKCNGMELELSEEDLEQALKAIKERSVAVIGKITLSPRGASTIYLKPRGDQRRMMISGGDLGEFKRMAAEILGLGEDFDNNEEPKKVET